MTLMAFLSSKIPKSFDFNISYADYHNKIIIFVFDSYEKNKKYFQFFDLLSRRTAALHYKTSKNKSNIYFLLYCSKLNLVLNNVNEKYGVEANAF